jgi:hypothetical protein
MAVCEQLGSCILRHTMAMKVAATVDSSFLRVHVEVDNPLAEPIYLMNWLEDWYGLLEETTLDAMALVMRDPEPTRELAFVCLGPAGEAVLLNGQGPKPHSDILPTRPRIPDSTRVQPGETVSWTLRLRLPLREWHAYDGLPSENVVPTPVTKIRYRLESLRQSTCSRRTEEHVNYPGLFRARGYPTDIAETVVSLPQPITLLRRMDQFDRF